MTQAAGGVDTHACVSCPRRYPHREPKPAKKAASSGKRSLPSPVAKPAPKKRTKKIKAVRRKPEPGRNACTENSEISFEFISNAATLLLQRSPKQAEVEAAKRTLASYVTHHKTESRSFRLDKTQLASDVIGTFWFLLAKEGGGNVGRAQISELQARAEPLLVKLADALWRC